MTNESKNSSAGREPRSQAKPRGSGQDEAASSMLRSYNLPDYRLEHPEFELHMETVGEEVQYRVDGDLTAPAPPIRESKYLSREQCVELYRWMLLNRRVESALETLYKQSKVIGTVYFGLGQEACSCAAAYALAPEDWMAPAFRNQGALMVRGFTPADIMRQYMAKADSPSLGRDGGLHFGDTVRRNVCAPITMLGEMISVMAGICLGARLQGRDIATLTYIGDGGQSTGVTYEGLNLAAVQRLGVVVIVENNLWGFSTPSDRQFRVKDLAERSIAYGIPGVIVDGTDPCQVYDITRDACERARRGEGPTLIEAKMMRMKGHAMHDAAQYVPRPLYEYWLKRDPIERFRQYLVERKQWLTSGEDERLVAEVDSYVESERAKAEASPMPSAQEDATHQGPYCEGNCHTVLPKYGEVKFGVKGKP
jgi:TPP-dependent pyruvate/acetoin dehydrogenase alpha subunit